MDNQHKLIKGYRDLSQEEINVMNEIKKKAEELNEVLDKLRKPDSGADPRWFSIGVTDLQKGFMAVIRSIAKPESF